MTLDEIPTGVHVLSHKFLKNLIRKARILDFYLFQDTLFGVHGCPPQLGGIHLTKTFIALDSSPFLPEFTGELPHLLFPERVPLLFSLRYPVQRGLGDVDVSFFYQPWHKPEEEGKEKSPDMGTVHIGIGH